MLRQSWCTWLCCGRVFRTVQGKIIGPLGNLFSGGWGKCPTSEWRFLPLCRMSMETTCHSTSRRSTGRKQSDSRTAPIPKDPKGVCATKHVDVHKLPPSNRIFCTECWYGFEKWWDRVQELHKHMWLASKWRKAADITRVWFDLITITSNHDGKSLVCRVLVLTTSTGVRDVPRRLLVSTTEDVEEVLRNKCSTQWKQKWKQVRVKPVACPDLPSPSRWSVWLAT